MEDEQMPFSHHKEFNRGFSSSCAKSKQENSGEEPTVKGPGGALKPLWQLKGNPLKNVSVPPHYSQAYQSK